MNKIEKCRFAFPDFTNMNGDLKIVYNCRNKDCKIEDTSICETCEKFSSKYIEYPIEVSAINTEKFTTEGIYSNRVGELVKIRPCAEEYNNKTFIGILLGDLVTAPHISYNNETKELNINSMTNPAIYVPELKKIIFGYESWWGTISDKENFKDISDEDIENTWYVKLLKEMNKNEEK